MTHYRWDDIDKLIDTMREKYGDSTFESRDAVLDAVGGTEHFEMLAMSWVMDSDIYAVHQKQIFIAFGKAVDFGYRIGRCQK